MNSPCAYPTSGPSPRPSRVTVLPRQLVREEARRRKIDLVVVPTAEAIGVLGQTTRDANAILHVTC
jgi:hypothetical protein